ncbi:hypothetical protein ANN_12937 [Periplaneta americana]|uniref:Uncharacterized protein n=1 Tax=Periplaneta americana TaxID=6978 RepID=A0ABQ8TJ09_PERAM|nr:hypothetical protein ANN_12937 [Periplaneta americana]
MAGLCEGGNEPPSSLKAVSDNAGEMSPGSSIESYRAFARIGLRENPGKNLNQVTCPDRNSNPSHLVSRPDALTVTPQTFKENDVDDDDDDIEISLSVPIGNPLPFAEQRALHYDNYLTMDQAFHLLLQIATELCELRFAVV